MTKPSRLATNDRRWPGLRLLALRRDDWRCVQCGARGQLEVDHILPTRDRPDLRFTLDNLQTLCRRCHTRKTRRDIGLPEPDPHRQAWIKQVACLQRGK